MASTIKRILDKIKRIAKGLLSAPEISRNAAKEIKEEIYHLEMKI